MRLLIISFLLAVISILLLPALNRSIVSADGTLRGRINMVYQGRPIDLRGVYVDKIADCNFLDNKNLCQSQSCLGQGFCPSIPQPYYTKADGTYIMEGGDSATLIINGQPGVCTQGGVEISCGINCGYRGHQFKALFPSNYDINNFPNGIDFRKGYWKATSDPTELTRATGRIVTESGSRNQFYQLEDMNNEGNLPDLNWEWVPDVFPIAGEIKDSASGQGVGSVTVEVYNDKGEKRATTTDTNGKFSVSNFIQRAGVYAVRVKSIPSGYKFPSAKTTTVGWTYSITTNTDTPVGSSSYELQQLDNSDCAGPALGGIDKGKTGRCNFTIDPQSASLPTRTPTPTSTPTACNTIPITSSINVTSVTLEDASGTLTNIDTINFNPLMLNLSGSSGTPGVSTKKVNVTYSNGACRSFNITFNYTPSALTPTPNPIPFIETSGGDVHSNEGINIDQ